MNYSRNKLRKLIIQSLENRYALDGSAFEITHEQENIICDLSSIDGERAEMALFDASSDAIALSWMSFEVGEEYVVGEGTTDNSELHKVYSIPSSSGEEASEYYLYDESAPIIVPVADVALFTFGIDESDDIDKSMWRTFAFSSPPEELVFDENAVVDDGNVADYEPTMIICYEFPEATTWATDFANSDDSQLYFDEEVEIKPYEVMTTAVVTEDGETVFITQDIVEFDEEMVQRTDSSFEVTTTSFESLPTWNTSDLNQDGKVTAFDAILLFNLYNSYFQSFLASEGMLAASVPTSIFEMENVDINGDSLFSPIDILVVINDLNAMEVDVPPVSSSLSILDNDPVDESADLMDVSASRTARAMLTLGLTSKVTSYLQDSTWYLSVDEAGTVTATNGESEHAATVGKDGQISVNGFATEWSLTNFGAMTAFSLTSKDDVASNDWAENIDTALLELYDLGT